MIKKLLVLWLVACSSLLYAQIIKTDVLVIGGNASGVAAGIQSARSKVKTVLVAENIHFSEPFQGNPRLHIRLSQYVNDSSGLWAEYWKHLVDYYKIPAGADTTLNPALWSNAQRCDSILKKITDTVKKLSVYLKTTFTSIKKDGDGWNVRFMQDGKVIDIKARVVVDATQTSSVAKKVGVKIIEGGELVDPKNPAKTFRTAIACAENRRNFGRHSNTYWDLLLSNIFSTDVDNLLVTENSLSSGEDFEESAFKFVAGQGVGAAAAYCAFYKTTTKNLNVRKIQGELLDFKAYLVPFADINPTDGDWRAIQQIGATGLLKGQVIATSFYFMPDAPVSTIEIEPVLTEIYTRAFLWFHKEKPGEKFTVANTLSLISDYTLTDPALLKSTVQKAWKTQYKFTLDFDLKRPVTRREFAMLINKYLNPFARTIDLDGRFLN
jgi:hypothetical protein